jgi:DNA-binding GntR family transcriptional regulator
MSQAAMHFEKLRDDIAASILSPGRRLSQQRIAIWYEVTKELTAASRDSGLPASHQILVEPIEQRDHDTAEKRMRCHVQSDCRFGLQEFLESRSA